jgi:hypothetical protein
VGHFAGEKAMSVSKAQVVLEELLTAAIVGALEARKKADRNPFDNGRLMAYYALIAVAKEQAEIAGMAFADNNLKAFDPDKELLRGRR